MSVDQSSFQTGQAFNTGGGANGGGMDLNALIQMLMQQVQDPTQSPAYKSQLHGLLASLAPSEKRATTNLQDMFRNAGNMASGQYGVAGANLQGDLMRNRQTLASELAGKVGASAQGPMGILAQLLQSQQQNQLRMQLAQMTGQGGGGTSDPFGMLNNSPPAPTTGFERGQISPSSSQPQQQADPYASLLQLLMSGQGGGGGGSSTQPNYDPFSGQTADLSGTGYGSTDTYGTSYGE